MTCALCSADAPLTDTPVTGGPDGASAALCATCAEQMIGTPDPDHWRCLAAAMWSEDAATQVLAARMLDRLSDHDWARDLADQLWLDDATRAWVENVARDSDHRDSNGVPLMQGDTVVLIKDLPVKGASFTAKRGTAVRGISLVSDNPAHIEGRVEGQRIVILTEFVKRRS
ncbi:alkylphosphonate utilization protein [uncultured Roseovarius sp.]|uniref:alkylphosphonate utilization protein n=1 Tax=uncultured Roseovarius sp. TaxID=293344 RepID=UPI00261A0C94|nr:alkylphosphonate utilization protein [uncultured Roseovarius sp.]